MKQFRQKTLPPRGTIARYAAALRHAICLTTQCAAHSHVQLAFTTRLHPADNHMQRKHAAQVAEQNETAIQ